jgi:U3 small nucleolar RNA-associated protein 7
MFDLNLNETGPYRLNYTRNGRHLLLGGRKGHISMLDWQSKYLHCEIQVNEVIQDVRQVIFI